MRYSDDMYIAMIKDLEENILTNNEIAKKYGCSLRTVEDFNGCKRHTKSFSCDKYGENEVFELAKKFREDRLKEMKIQSGPLGN